jgi:hypothetical protein
MPAANHCGTNLNQQTRRVEEKQRLIPQNRAVSPGWIAAQPSIRSATDASQQTLRKPHVQINVSKSLKTWTLLS